jgi:hypothetical protein
MAIIIKTEHKNGAKNIKESRAATTLSNFEEDKLIWAYIASNPCSSLFPKSKKTITGRKGSDLVYNTVGDKIANHIVRNLSNIYHVNDVEGVSIQMIAEVAQAWIAADIRTSITYCRNASRQSIDERVQLATLKKYTNSLFNWDKPHNGLYTIHDGEIFIADTKQKKKYIKKANARSIDFICDGKGITINVFAKYTKECGSSQDHQLKESKHFIHEAMKFVDSHKNNTHFYVLIDGEWGESHLPELDALCNQYPTINCGNCESLINFINSL